MTVEGRSTKIPRESLANVVASHLRRDLVMSVIKPGEPIRVAPLEERFGISHIPIREALRQLEAEGLVVSMPQRGAVAAEVSLGEISEIWDLRRIVEGQIVRRAAMTATDEGRAAALSELETMRKEAVLDMTTLSFREAHTSFHFSLTKPYTTRWSEDVLRRLWQGSERYIGLFMTISARDYEEFMREHDSLAQAFVSGDGPVAEEALLNHISLTEKEVRSGYIRTAEAEVGPSSVD